jgi:hypothetical protein
MGILDLKMFQSAPMTRRPPETLGFGIPTEAEVTAQGGTALDVVKNVSDGSWDTFVGLVATAGYINVGIDASQENHRLIPILKKTSFPT